ncbi:hypothetical protein BUALT_Bualt05G0105100 [Buddleja alternifolia]|uniref:HAT C-terminal dimerisation domain-containing protein n=1 Tax=Buddleja alternifolia TaxID=168488 RepID=A0AAV6XJM7_9LAMI|nr:hypothetical protein BUALT_Bualt05G0105100 [Buddleja alternifolia]
MKKQRLLTTQPLGPTDIAINSQGSTTLFYQHLDNCPIFLSPTKKQRLLTTQPLGPTGFGGGSGGTITTYRDVFPRYKERDPSYLWLASSEDWDRALKKANILKFKTLSTMARDILSIPITTVASESAFSAGGRAFDQYLNSLNQIRRGEE